MDVKEDSIPKTRRTFRDYVLKRCWPGYRPVINKKPFEKGSCEKINKGLGTGLKKI